MQFFVGEDDAEGSWAREEHHGERHVAAGTMEARVRLLVSGIGGTTPMRGSCTPANSGEAVPLLHNKLAPARCISACARERGNTGAKRGGGKLTGTAGIREERRRQQRTTASNIASLAARFNEAAKGKCGGWPGL